jgi:hypothetical protein
VGEDSALYGIPAAAVSKHRPAGRPTVRPGGALLPASQQTVLFCSHRASPATLAGNKIKQRKYVRRKEESKEHSDKQG